MSLVLEGLYQEGEEMTKEEEIKKETGKLIDRCYTKGSPDYPKLMVFQRQKFLKELLPLLDGLGVVIKVDRELPNDAIYRSLKQEEAYCDGRDTVINAGYVAVEPLIGENDG